MCHAVLEKLCKKRRLNLLEWKHILHHWQTLYEPVRAAAQRIAQEQFGGQIYYRGIVEFTNYCRNDCLYCGLRRSNRDLVRYRLSADAIIAACAEGYEQGIRTFVLQGGEDSASTDAWLADLLDALNAHFPLAAITLSLGERSPKSYQMLRAHGAARYLLRHETASPAHYASLHPSEQSFWKRIDCLYTLKNLGYQTGCGMMVGSPNQTEEDLANDLLFIQEFQPAMVGIGPFLPHHATPFALEPAGSAKRTLYILALVRLLIPTVLLPATTALKTTLPNGYAEGILSGCNVIMPNITPKNCKPNYLLYDNKPISDDLSSALSSISDEIAPLGVRLVSARGDFCNQGASSVTPPHKGVGLVDSTSPINERA